MPTDNLLSILVALALSSTHFLTDVATLHKVIARVYMPLQRWSTMGSRRLAAPRTKY